MEPILSVRELTKTFSRPGQGKLTAVNGVSFDLRPGERLGIIGESGSGKTTVANLITRLLDADGGRILLDGEDITSVTGRDLRRVYRKIQMPSQAKESEISSSVTSRFNPEFTRAEVSPIVSVAETKKITTTAIIAPRSNFILKGSK